VTAAAIKARREARVRAALALRAARADRAADDDKDGMAFVVLQWKYRMTLRA